MSKRGKKKKSTRKALHQEMHAKMRIDQRLDVDCPSLVYVDILDDIRNGRLEYLGCKSHRVKYFLYEVGGKRFVCVYDKKRKTIVTVLPEEWKKEIISGKFKGKKGRN